jgi:hypothetical protein
MFSDLTALLERADSPLQPDAKKFLRESLEGAAVAENAAASLKLLGVKNSITR